jgi:hypothetical protein
MPSLLDDLHLLVARFERGELGQILHIVGPKVRKHLDKSNTQLFDRLLDLQTIRFFDGKHAFAAAQECVTYVVELHDALLGLARPAMACWIAAGRQLGVAKDIRVTIAKMLWREAWQWAGKLKELPLCASRRGAQCARYLNLKELRCE